MIQRGRLLLLGLVLGSPALAGDEPKRAQPAFDSEYNKDSRFYLARLSQLREELARFEKDRRWHDVVQQMIATQYSYTGRYQKALEIFDNRPGTAKTMEPAPELDGYEPQDAVAALLALADRHRVIMINEAHHVPMHRALTLRLLEGLYRKGFRYFAAETLTARDTELQKRGYPTLETGWYTHEPMYADLVRTAVKVGYTVVPYEFEAATPPGKATDPVAAQNAREEGQARNLKERILAKDPAAKILVHAGYAHVSKQPATWNFGKQKGEVRFMAVAFKALTGIDPLSVDQTLMTERGNRDREPAEYRAVLEKGLVKDQPVVLVKKGSNDYFVPAAVRGTHDLVVIHPRSRYEKGRPTWLALDGRRTPHTVKTELRPRPGSSLLAQAFIAREAGAKAVPIDQMEFTADEPAPTLWLPAGKMRVRIVDDRGETLHEYHAEANAR
jgi:hypothetical protein